MKKMNSWSISCAASVFFWLWTYQANSAPTGLEREVECAKTLGSRNEIVVSDIPRLIHPQFPDESGVFPKGIFFGLLTANGTPVRPSSIEGSNCFLNLALGKEVVRAMVRGANKAVRQSSGVLPTLKQVENVMAGVDKELGRTISVSPGRNLTLLDIQVFMVEAYQLGAPRRGVPSPMQAAIYEDKIYQEWTSIDYVLTQFLVHRGVKLNIDDIRSALQNRDKDIAPPTTYSASDCSSGIKYDWPTASGAISADGAAAPLGVTVHWGVCESTKDLYAYEIDKGWRNATVNERQEVCKMFDHVLAIHLACTEH